MYSRDFGVWNYVYNLSTNLQKLPNDIDNLGYLFALFLLQAQPMFLSLFR